MDSSATSVDDIAVVLGEKIRVAHRIPEDDIVVDGVDCLGVDRSYGEIWRWTHSLAYAQSGPPTASPSRTRPTDCSRTAASWSGARAPASRTRSTRTRSSTTGRRTSSGGTIADSMASNSRRTACRWPVARSRWPVKRRDAVRRQAGRPLLPLRLSGQCCAGADSDYRVVVGRTDDLRGPYVSHIGEPLLDWRAGVFGAPYAHWLPEAPGGASQLTDEGT